MDCLRCLQREGILSELTYENGDQQRLYLCGSCTRYFEADQTVSDIAQASTV